MGDFCRYRLARLSGCGVAVLLLAAGAGAAFAQSAPPPDIGGVYVVGQKFVLGNGMLQHPATTQC